MVATTTNAYTWYADGPTATKTDAALLLTMTTMANTRDAIHTYQRRLSVAQVRPDRQTMLFSATFARRVQGLAADVLRDPVRLVVGSVGEASDHVDQTVTVLADDRAKWPWLMPRLDAFAAVRGAQTDPPPTYTSPISRRAVTSNRSSIIFALSSFPHISRACVTHRSRATRAARTERETKDRRRAARL